MTTTPLHPTSERLAALRSRLPGDAAALVGDLADVRWLTGLASSHAQVLVLPDTAWLLTDFRYRDAAGLLAGPELQVHIETDLLAAAATKALEAGVPSLLLARDKVTLAEDARLGELLGPGVERVAGPREVAALRAVKSPAEIAAIAASQHLADEAFREVVLERGITGLTEREVAMQLEIAMRARGAEGVSFAPIVAAGAHGALPHASPRDARIPKDELVVIDWGAQLDGYCSDCTRTVATGDLDQERQTVHEIVRAAQVAALGTLRAGVEARDVDAAARALIDGEGYGEAFGHGLGHGVGLEVHEGPTVSTRGTATLEPGMVVTVEPGIYLPGRFGVRVEELAVVTAAGEPQVLTGLDREAMHVG